MLVLVHRVIILRRLLMAVFMYARRVMGARAALVVTWVARCIAWLWAELLVLQAIEVKAGCSVLSLCRARYRCRLLMLAPGGKNLKENDWFLFDSNCFILRVPIITGVGHGYGSLSVVDFCRSAGRCVYLRFTFRMLRIPVVVLKRWLMILLVISEWLRMLLVMIQIFLRRLRWIRLLEVSVRDWCPVGGVGG